MAENFDQTRARSPFTSVDGSETVVLHQDGVTKGGFLSVLRDWIVEGLQVVTDQISNATAFGRNLLQLDDRAALNGLIDFPSTASSGELEEGTQEEIRSLSPSLLVEAIAFHTAPKNPQSIDSNHVISDDDVNSILVCDATSEIDITLPVIAGLQRGAIEIINLADTPVSIIPDSVIIIDSTGATLELTVEQYAYQVLIYLGDDTWYAREQ